MRCHLYHFNLLCSRTAGFFRSACGGTPVDCFRIARNWKRKSSNSRLGISATCFEVGNSADATAARKRERALARSSRTALCSLARSPQACAWRGCFDESPQMSEAKRKITSASPPEPSEIVTREVNPFHADRTLCLLLARGDGCDGAARISHQFVLPVIGVVKGVTEKRAGFSQHRSHGRGSPAFSLNDLAASIG
jgi:hypothetical protein